MKITEIPAKPQDEKTIRVAAYARVSADKDAASHSLETQMEYYANYIKQRSDWILVDVYSDNGISGTTDHRPEFQRMLNDCRKGKVDLIITKSITRFARNTVVLLETIRELKAIGIDVFFEKENMHSISPDGELMLTLLAIYAEEEAKSASENQKWRIRKKFEKGEPWVGNMLGYRLINGEMIIIPEEAEIVKMIFNDYLSGMGFQAIARKLNNLGIPARLGNYWHTNAVLQILHNEKYAGNMLLQKTYRPDFKVKHNKPNHGEKRQYFVENSHEAIINPEVFKKAQDEARRRSEKYFAVHKNNNSEGNLFAGLMTCGLCNSPYRKRIAHSTSKPEPTWICSKYFELGKQYCSSQQIPEDILVDKTKKVLGVDDLSREIIAEEITKIDVTGHFHLRFNLKDGSARDVVWEHKSRRDSWTDEMKEAARQRALERRRKETK